MIGKLIKAVEVGVRAALETTVETRVAQLPAPEPVPVIQQVDVRGLRFTAERPDDPFIPIAGVLLLKGIREDCNAPVYRELYTDDLSTMERVGMCQSAADTWRDWIIRNSRHG